MQVDSPQSASNSERACDRRPDLPEGCAGGSLSVTWHISSAACRRISAAMFLAGFATFSLVYCVQPLLPAFARDFHIGPVESSLALSATTGALAAAILCAAPGSEVLGRRGVMFGSMCAAAILN